MSTETIAPAPTTGAGPIDKRETRIRTMFGNIAPRYDLLNHLLSLNIDRYWRWRTTRLAPPDPPGAVDDPPAPILDVCTGTGDLALAYDRAARRRAPIIGADFCLPMLLPAREKTRRQGAASGSPSSRPTPSDCPFPTMCSSS